jgi:(2Fe-2S) ferredoxin
MGLCAEGANVLIYPQKIWFSRVAPDTLEEIIATLALLVENDTKA